MSRHAVLPHLPIFDAPVLAQAWSLAQSRSWPAGPRRLTRRVTVEGDITAPIESLGYGDREK
jgi:hypothetical protein